MRIYAAVCVLFRFSRHIEAFISILLKTVSEFNMEKITLLLGAIILSSSVIVDAEPSPGNIGYPLTADNGYDYSNGLSSERYLAGKTDHRGNGDFYSTTQQYSLVGSGSPVNIGSGASYASQDSGFTGLSGTPRDSLTANSYTFSTHTSPNHGGYSSSSSGSSNAESSFEGYNAGIGHGPSDFAHFASSGNHEVSPYDGFPADMPASATFGAYSDSATRMPNFVDYPASNHPVASSHSYTSSYPNDYSMVKQKGRRNKYRHDSYPVGSEQHYTRGNRGSIYSGRTRGPGFSSGSRPNGVLSSIHVHGPNFYGTEKTKKQVGSKYIPAYASTAAFSYLPREHEDDHVSGSYAKGPGKIIVIKEGGPTNYGGGPVHSTGSSTSNGMLTSNGSYKGKGNGILIGYDVPYAANPSFSNALSSTAYGDGHVLRGYANTNGHLTNTRHTRVYPDYS